MTIGFYKAFEDRYRGSRELIKSRLLSYCDFIKPLGVAYPESSAIDLGCGRGEWLEIVGAHGFKGIGVDSDAAMINACNMLGLNAKCIDATEYLKSLRDESVAIVSGFHIVEHIDFVKLQVLVQEALRVLLPGGLLILETPNPENIVVGGSDFYLDPTHLRPLPPMLLAFLPEHYGFFRTKIIRLQEEARLASETVSSLRDVLRGVSPDYAVLAQKNGDQALVESLNGPFSREYGLTLDHLLAKFDQNTEHVRDRLQAVEDLQQRVADDAHVEALEKQAAIIEAQTALIAAQGRVVELEMRATVAESQAQLAKVQSSAAGLIEKLAGAEAHSVELHSALMSTRDELQRALHSGEQFNQQLQVVRQELRELHHANHNNWTLANVRGQQIEALLSSGSWRITAPLRWFVGVARRESRDASEPRVSNLTDRLIRWALKKPALVNFVSRRASGRPFLHEKLAPRDISAIPSNPLGVVDSNRPDQLIAPMPDIALTSHASRIHQELQIAIKNECEEAR